MGKGCGDHSEKSLKKLGLREGKIMTHVMTKIFFITYMIDSTNIQHSIPCPNSWNQKRISAFVVDFLGVSGFSCAKDEIHRDLSW